MGITKASIQFLCYIAENDVDFEKSLMIGRQTLYATTKEINSVLRKYDCTYKNDILGGGYSEELFRYFGARIIESIDFSDYESATLLHDLNFPVGENLKNKYTMIWDGGTLEHIFNYPVAIKNCMDMLCVGGHLILETPANNFFGHGLYQFSPELFFSLFCRKNGFDNTRIFMQNDKSKWYEVISPEITKRRTAICSSKNKPVNMFVISRKIETVPDALILYQSDYVAMWNQEGAKQKLSKIVKIIPEILRKFRRRILEIMTYKSRYLQFYKPILEFDKQQKRIHSWR
jgi:hypothetical protein